MKNAIIETVKNIKGLPSRVHDEIIEYLGTDEVITYAKISDFIESINGKINFHKYEELKKAIKNLYYIDVEIYRGPNSIYGNPSFLVESHSNEKIMKKLIELEVFKKYKRGLSTCNNASFAFQICRGTTEVKLYGYTIKFQLD